MMKKRFLLCTICFVLCMGITGCASKGASVNRGKEEEASVWEQRKAQEEIDMVKPRYADVDLETIECAAVEVEFENTEVLEKRDILVFVTQDTREIFGAVKTNGDIWETKLPPDEYYVCSDAFEPTKMMVENADQEFIIKVDYKEKTLEIIEK